ncbi:microfibril-associated glycoprotein 4-like [Branchiostoma lanceolatum]|uniref:microfibril-associated glycoprotein 4-like n=1 Tax=Branchiostoma lanceolatum TaxID=7740 RepID=UPI003454404E
MTAITLPVLVLMLLHASIAVSSNPWEPADRSLTTASPAVTTASPAVSCQAFENLLRYADRQNSLENNMDELQTRTNSLEQQCCGGESTHYSYASIQSMMEQQDSTIQQHENTIQQQAATIQLMQTQLNQLADRLSGPRDCMELLATGHDTSDVYTIYPDGGGKSPVQVYCDMDTDGGGWTLFQKRENGLINFYQDWQTYKIGFGDLRGEFWLGNDNLHRLTDQGVYELRVELEDFEGNSAHANYSIFHVEDEIHKYKLTVTGYTGDAGDAMAHHDGMYFSTRDRDNDIHGTDCAERFQGAWWYGACHHANLNGQYLVGAHTSFADGINWYPWKGHNYSLKTTEMKIRPN